jgi:hypothetical protein
VKRVSTSHAGEVVDPRAFACLHKASTAAHASACRNVAAGHLAAAVESVAALGLSAAGAASPAAAAAAASAVSRCLADAHSVLQRGLEAVQQDTARFQPLRRNAQPGAAPQPRTQAVLALLRAADTDLELHAAHLQASLAEAALLSSLWAAWTEAHGAAPAAGKPDAETLHDSAASPASLFFMSSEQQAAVSAPLKAAAEAAEASLRQFDALLRQPTDAGTAPVMLRCADYGLDLGGGIARPLRLLAVLQLLARKPVMSEGLLRSALDHLETDITLRGPQGQPEHWPAAAGPGRYARFPLLLQAAVGGTLHAYGQLLLQWERREEEGKRVLSTGAALLDRAAPFLGCRAGPVRPALDAAPATTARTAGAVSPARLAFMRSSLLAAAAGTVHAGSVSGALAAGFAALAA